MTYRSEKLSRAMIRELALEIRKKLGIENVIRIPVMQILEIVMPKLCPRFVYHIASKDELRHGVHAEIDVVSRFLKIREDVYEGAVNGRGRDRMTIMHEIAHLILIVILGVKLTRTFTKAPVPAYKDPEWQAKALAGELMCPAHLIKRLTPEQIAVECGVSLEAARYQLDRC